MAETRSDISTETMQDGVLEDEGIRDGSITEKDEELAQQEKEPVTTEPTSIELDWDNEPENPRNWSKGQKAMQVVMLSSTAFLASVGTSILSPARTQIMEEFNVSSTVALVPLTMYVLALGFGPVIGGPLSETIGRYPVYVGSVPLGALFALGCGFVHNIGGLSFLRFMSGLCWGPVLAVASGSLVEVFDPKSRGPVSAVFILMPFLGPGLGPVIGSFVVHRKGWRWTQWTLLFFAIFAMITTALTRETFYPVIKRRLAKQRGLKVEKQPPLASRLKTFAVISLIRPVRMVFTEPIVGFFCLYVAAEFGTLFSFFAAVPYTFGTVYHFSIEKSGLVFLSIVIGCVMGLVTIILCDVVFYRKQIPKYAQFRVPPEHRLYPAMIGSIGPPIGLFWFGWTARESISWASPAAAIIVFAWGNLCIFVSAIQYMADTYHGNVVASASGANSLVRYGFAGVFPLFTLQMFEKLGIDWASSLLGFVALCLMPVPWVLFKYGAQIRARSTYETVDYS